MAVQSECLAIRLCTPQHGQSWHHWFCFLCLGASNTSLQQLQRPRFEFKSEFEFKHEFKFGSCWSCCCPCERRVFGGSPHCFQPGSFPPFRCLPALQLPATAGTASGHGPFSFSSPRHGALSFSDSFPQAFSRGWAVLSATVPGLPTARSSPPRAGCAQPWFSGT